MCCQIEHSPGTLSISSKKPCIWAKRLTPWLKGNRHVSSWWSTLTGFHDLCTHRLVLNPEISPPFSNSFALISKWRNAMGFKVLLRTTELPHCIFPLRMQGKNHRWSQRAASGMSRSQLPQAYLTAEANYNLLLSRKDYSAFTLQSHTLPFLFQVSCAPSYDVSFHSSQSPQKGFSVLRTSCINLKGGTSGSSSCLFCDISDYNAQWTIVTIINHQHLCNFWDETKTQKWTLMS